LTRRHAEAVSRLLQEAGLDRSEIDVIGFHGQTIDHDPDHGRTWQIGDGDLLARAAGVPVVNDFRSEDMAHGGQGAPFASLYHQALCADLEKPVAILNLGGVANVTWIGPGGEDDILAFDTGPASAPIDDWVLGKTGAEMDEGGRLAAKGQVHRDVIDKALAHPYLAKQPPKSLDRNDFTADLVEGLSIEDGAATLSALVAETVARGADFFPAPAKRWLVTGGGRHNDTIMTMLRARLGAPVEPVEAVGWDGTMIEAQAFAFLSVRSMEGLPLSVPGTTGVPRPVTGGRLHKPKGSN